MTSIDKIKTNKPTPTSLILYPDNAVGRAIIKSLLTQEGFVIVIDKFSSNSVDKMKDFFGSEYFIYLDESALKDLPSYLNRLDYVFYLNHEYSDPVRQISADDFFYKSNEIKYVLDIVRSYNSKFVITTSINIFQLLSSSYKEGDSEQFLTYTVQELQRYYESVVIESARKKSIDTRVVRLGNVLGKDIDVDSNAPYIQNIRNAVLGRQIQIVGDGLEPNYYIHQFDAAYGVVKALFSKNTVGKVINLALDQDFTTLNLCYLLQDLEPNAQGLGFREGSISKDIINVKDISSTVELLKLKFKYSFEKSLVETLDEFHLKLLHNNEEKSENDLNNDKLFSNQEIVNNDVDVYKKELLDIDNQVEEKSFDTKKIIETNEKMKGLGILEVNDTTAKIESDIFGTDMSKENVYAYSQVKAAKNTVIDKKDISDFKDMDKVIKLGKNDYVKEIQNNRNANLQYIKKISTKSALLKIFLFATLGIGIFVVFSNVVYPLLSLSEKVSNANKLLSKVEVGNLKKIEEENINLVNALYASNFQSISKFDPTKYIQNVTKDAEYISDIFKVNKDIEELSRIFKNYQDIEKYTITYDLSQNKLIIQDKLTGKLVLENIQYVSDIKILKNKINQIKEYKASNLDTIQVKNYFVDNIWVKWLKIYSEV